MSSFTWPPEGGGGGGVTVYTNLAAFPSAASSGNGALGIALDTNILFESNGAAWVAISGPGVVLSLGAFGSTPNANGASDTSNVLTLQPADGTHPGGVSITTQTFAGAKTFSGSITASNFSGTSSGTNTGDVTLGTADGLSLLGQVLSLQLATTSLTGALSSTDWNTFNNKQPAGNYANTNLSNLASPTAVNQSLLPGATSTLDLGKDLKTWDSAYVNFIRDSAGQQIVMNIQGRTLNGSAGTAVFAWDTSGLDAKTHLIHNVVDPVAAQDAATKNYVDAVASALNPATSVYAATTSNIPGTYLNGVAGIGATFTTTATGALTIDGVIPPLGSRVLIKDQSTGFQNGIYNITTLGSIGVSTIFTRSLDYNTPTEVDSAGLIPVINGTLNALSSWQQVAVVTTIGTDALVFTEFTANPSLYLLKANNLNDVVSASTSFNNLSPMTTVGDMIIGGTSGAATRLAATTNGFTLTLVSGSPAWAATTLAYSALTGTVPIWNQNTTGNATTATTATNLAGGSGGTIPYQSAANTTAMLTNGNAGQVLQSNGTTLPPTWVAPGARGYAVSTADVTDDLITGATYATIASSPTLSYTPSTSGTYKVYASIPAQSPSDYIFVQIIATTGSPTVLTTQQALCSGNSSVIKSSLFVQTVFTLTATTAYTFDIQARVVSGTGVILGSSGAPIYIFLEQVG